jgi:hypothetical protein
MSDPDRLQVSILRGQVAHTKGQNDIDCIQASTLLGQVSHTGGDSGVPGVSSTSVRSQVAHTGGDDILSGVYATIVGAQIAYTETYPTLLRSRWAPRILVDIFGSAMVGTFSTEDVYLEEL